MSRFVVLKYVTLNSRFVFYVFYGRREYYRVCIRTILAREKTCRCCKNIQPARLPPIPIASRWRAINPPANQNHQSRSAPQRITLEKGRPFLVQFDATWRNRRPSSPIIWNSETLNCPRSNSCLSLLAGADSAWKIRKWPESTRAPLLAYSSHRLTQSRRWEWPCSPVQL